MKSIMLISILFVIGNSVLGEMEAPRTFARYVPERLTDFAWENDMIAFRAYGPALRSAKENSGIDCWLKRVDYPIINKWYEGSSKGKSYHTDHGEGHDPYHVGSSAGCGGTGLWIDDQREPLETYTKHELIECTPKRTIFKLTYEREINGTVYGEEKTITIEISKRLFEVNSIFTKDGKVAAKLPVCIGITTHDGKGAPSYSKAKGWIACWEALAGSELGTAVRMDPAHIDQIRNVESKQPDESHIFIIAKTDNQGRLHYQAGYGWAKAGKIKTSKDWKNYLEQQGE